MADNNGVMVIGECGGGKLASITGELLGCGRRLAEALGVKVDCVLIGDSLGPLGPEAIAGGADRVLLAQDALLGNYQADLYELVVAGMVTDHQPAIVLFGQTDLGRDLAPRVAFRLKTAVTTDCVELTIDSATKRLLQTKPVYGGNALATFVTESQPKVATIRQKSMPSLERDNSRQGEVIPVQLAIDQSAARATTKQRVSQEGEGVRLEDASVVVSGGRGIGSAEGFKQLQELATLLKGAVGASRPPCDNAWAPTTQQVGLTGKIVAPDVYIAVGISGASQHLAGCSGAKAIVSINRDPEANIFKQACYGAVGDWKQILPAFIAKVRELKAG